MSMRFAGSIFGSMPLPSLKYCRKEYAARLSMSFGLARLNGSTASAPGAKAAVEAATDVRARNERRLIECMQEIEHDALRIAGKFSRLPAYLRLPAVSSGAWEWRSMNNQSKPSEQGGTHIFHLRRMDFHLTLLLPTLESAPGVLSAT